MAKSQEDVLNEKYSLNFNNITLYDALVKISQETGYHFSYDASYIQGETNISFSFRNRPLREIIHQIMGGLEFDLKIVGNQIILSKPFESPVTTDNIGQKIEIYPFMRFRGEVVDAKNKKPIPFATVSVIGESFGTITNENGMFVLKIPKEYVDKTISIASMGYKSLEIPINNTDTTYQTYPLKHDLIPIQEVIIRKKEPHTLIKTAVEKIPENYSTEPALYTTFYRESIKKNKEYVAHSEAVLFIHKSPYNNEFTKDQVKIFKSRKTLNVSQLDTLMLKLKGGIETSLLLDLAKNPSNLITEENFKFYKYNLTDIILYDDQPTYVIEFDQKENIEYPLFKGRIYIDVKTFGIRGAEFSLSKHRLDKAADYMVVKRSRRVKVKPLGADYMVKYREINGKFYVNHIRFETHFRVRKRKKFFSNDFTTITEMAVNNIDTTNVKRFKFREVANIGEVFQDQIHTYDSMFWGHLNYLLPDEPLEDAIQQINKILNK